MVVVVKADPEELDEGDRRIDVGDVTLVWGAGSRWKARLREESRERHLERPVGERLRAALELVMPRRDS